MDDSKRLIFVGFKLTDEVSDGFVESSSRDRVYLEDPTYLETVTIDGNKYVGKRAQNGIAIDRLEDIARSVVSLMARVSESWTTRADQVLVIAVEEDEPTAQAIVPKDEAEQGDAFDYSGLVD